MTVGPALRTAPRAMPYLAWPRVPGDAERPGDRDAAAASVARMWNYHLDGKDHYTVDRNLADRALRAAPLLSRLVQINRTFLGNTARLLAGRAGIRQFLDIGCGLPSRENLHDVVQRADPACRVAYVDNDPMVLAHVRALLAIDPGTLTVEADLREPAAILGHPDLRRLIDFGEPVGVLLLSVLDFVTDAEDPRGIVDGLLAGLPPGSHLVISHAERTPELDAVSRLYAEAGVPFTPRSRQEIAELCTGLDMPSSYPAGLSPPNSGHRPGAGGAIPLIGCVGRKPE